MFLCPSLFFRYFFFTKHLMVQHIYLQYLITFSYLIVCQRFVPSPPHPANKAKYETRTLSHTWPKYCIHGALLSVYEQKISKLKKGNIHWSENKQCNVQVFFVDCINSLFEWFINVQVALYWVLAIFRVYTDLFQTLYL